VSSEFIALNTGFHNRVTGLTVTLLTVGCPLPGFPVVGEGSKVLEIFTPGMIVNCMGSAVFMVMCLLGDDLPIPRSGGLVERCRFDWVLDCAALCIDAYPFFRRDCSLSSVVVDLCTTGWRSSRSCSGLSSSGFELLGITGGLVERCRFDWVLDCAALCIDVYPFFRRDCTSSVMTKGLETIVDLIPGDFVNADL